MTEEALDQELENKTGPGEGQESDEDREQREAAEEAAKKEAEEAERREQEETEKKPWFKQRFDKITRQKYEQQQRADAAEQRARELEQRIQKLETKDAKPPELKPTRPKPNRKEFFEKHDDPDDAMAEYAEAVADWKLEQYTAKSRSQAQQHQIRQQQEEQEKAFENKRQKTMSMGQQKYSDWMDVVNSIPEALMPPVLANAIVEMENGSEVAYYLGKNLQDAERIAGLTPYALVAELGKIEAKISNPEKKQTSAPSPPKTLKGTGTPKTEIDPEKDPEGWIKARNEGRI